MRVKKLFLFAAVSAITLVNMFFLPSSFADENIRSDGDSKIKDVLLITPDHASSAETENERQVILALSSSGYSVDHISEDECSDYLSVYSNVIYLPGTDGSHIKENAGHTMILGVMPDNMIRALGCSADVKTVDDGNVVYTDSGISEPGSLSTCLDFYGDDYRSGTISAGEESFPIVVGMGRVRNIQMNNYSSALAKTIMIRQVNSWFQNESTSDSSVSSIRNYLVLTGVCSDHTEKLNEISQSLASMNTRYTLGILPEDMDSLSSEYQDAIILAEQHGAGIALDLSQTKPSEIDEKKIRTLVRRLAKRKIFPSALIVDSSQLLASGVLEKLPSSLLIVNGDSALHDANTDGLITLSDEAFASGKQILFPISMYGDGSYHNGSFGGAICVGFDLPLDTMEQRCGQATTSDITLSAITDDPKADLYKGSNDLGPATVSYVSSGQKDPLPADRINQLLSRKRTRICVTVIAVFLMLFANRKLADH